MPKYVTTGTYHFTRIAYALPSCPHHNVQLSNINGMPTLVCACGSRWTLTSLQYDVPPVVNVEYCGSCAQPVSSDQPHCSMHLLRAAALACVTQGDDTHLVLRALEYTAETMLETEITGRDFAVEVLRNAARVLMQKVKQTENAN